MNSSKTKKTKSKNRPAAFPSNVFRDTCAALLEFAVSDDEERAIGKVVQSTIPPPSLVLIEQMAAVLIEVGLLTAYDKQRISKYCERNAGETSLTRTYHEKVYPVPFALMHLQAAGANEVQVRNWAIKSLVRFVKEPRRDRFSGHVAYRHTIAFRDVLQDFFDSRTLIRGHSANSASIEDVDGFIARQKQSPLLTPYTIGKYETVVALICGGLQLGERQKRGGSSKRPRSSIGTELAVSPEHLDELTEPNFLQSAEVGDAFMDEDGLFVSITHPPHASRCDQYKVDRLAENGFARRNTPSVADMNICSKATFSEYMTWAFRSLPKPEYGVTWLLAFAGLDLARPLRTAVCKSDEPQGDELLLKAQSNSLDYHVLRRVDKEDPETHESAGIMSTPLPDTVFEGLTSIHDRAMQHDVIERCRKAANGFSRHHTGLTPTPNRLRASSAVLVRLRKMSMLEQCGVAGRVLPALKGISAYYRTSVSATVEQFASAYSDSVAQLQICAPALDVPKTTEKGEDKDLFCQSAIQVDAVGTLVEELANAYRAIQERIDSKGLLCEINDVLLAANLHETARYVVQQSALGIRPVGKVAKVSFAEQLGAVVFDKRSRLFAERSFAPVPALYLAFDDCSALNRSVLKQYLRNSGISLETDGNIFDLAAEFRRCSSDAKVLRTRLTNGHFRHEAPIASKIVDLNFKHNWLRHASIRHLAGRFPQWIADEFFGHRRIGREPLATWSTAGTSHFGQLQRALQDWLSSILPGELLKPIRIRNVKIQDG